MFKKIPCIVRLCRSHAKTMPIVVCKDKAFVDSVDSVDSAEFKFDPLKDDPFEYHLYNFCKHLECFNMCTASRAYATPNAAQVAIKQEETTCACSSIECQGKNHLCPICKQFYCNKHINHCHAFNVQENYVATNVSLVDMPSLR